MKTPQRFTIITLILSFGIGGFTSALHSQVRTETTRIKDAAKDIFGRESKNQTEVFVASDVPKVVEQGVKKTLAVAVEAWGSSGRLEYWVLGTDRKAAMELSEKFCAKRAAAGHMTRQECLEDASNQDHGFLMYQEIGAKALESGKPRGSAGHNGGAQWGFHNMTSSLPLGFAGKLRIAGESEQVTLFHEYWHSIQNSFIQTQDHEKRRKLMGPVWFIEGSAVAMAEMTTTKLWKNKKLPRWKNSPHQWPSFEKRMLDKLKIVKSKSKECPTLLPNSYDTDCRELAYEGGAWAIVYLLNKSGNDALLKSFHPRVEKLGWEGAFQETFHMTSKEFKAEFAKFIELSQEEQIKILPKF